MTTAGSRRPRRSPRGQILVIVGVGMLAFLGMAGLVTDVGLVYLSQRYQRNLTDSAALAGAQELQQPGSRAVTAAHRTSARTLAMTNLMNELSPGWGSLPACGYGADFTDCPIPGTPYQVSVRTPSTICIECDPDRAILVELTRHDVPALFSRIFGRTEWTVRQTSVAGINFAGKFAVLTLRPPQPGHDDQNDPNISMDGTGAVLNVPEADVGTNTTMTLPGGGIVNLDDGYKVHHYDPDVWVGAPDEHYSYPKLIEDPDYPYPVKPTSSTVTYNNDTQALMDPIQCAALQLTVPLEYVVDGQPVQDADISNVECYKKGVYTYQPTVENNVIGLLEPGVYFFDQGIRVREALIGGWDGGDPGVALVFRACTPGGGPGCVIDANNATVVALNGGDNYLAPGTEASAAVGWDGQLAETGGDPNLAVTIYVEKLSACFEPDGGDGKVPLFEPDACAVSGTINMAGNGSLYLAGVQYAPTDNVKIGGGSSGTGYVGQIISWTVKYSGGSVITQNYPAPDPNGVLRLDAACSGGGATGMSNAACNP